MKSISLIISFLYYYVNLVSHTFRELVSTMLDKAFQANRCIVENKDNGTRLIVTDSTIRLDIVDYKKWINSPSVKRQLEGAKRIKEYTKYND